MCVASLVAESKQFLRFSNKTYQEHLNSVPVPDNNAQTESFHKIKRNYREKSQNNGRNSIGWGATTTCYAASFAHITPNWLEYCWKIIKTAAAGFLTAFNNGLADANENAARAITKVIQQMPGKGRLQPNHSKKLLLQSSIEPQ